MSFWYENKQFYYAVLSAINQPTPESIIDLEKQLKIYRIRLLNLFKHTPKTALDRQKVQAATKDGIKFDTRDKLFICPQQFVDEALILSDLFDLNEALALQLIKTAHQETVEHPDFARGLCAVYLYYKSHWYLAEAIKTLFFNRSGISWVYAATERPEELKTLIDSFTEQLWKDGFLTNLLETVLFDVSKELDRLQQPHVKGLGNARHKHMVTETIVGTYTALGDSLFYWVCQTPLSTDEFAAVMRVVRNFDFTKDDQYAPINRVRCSLFMTALQAIDFSFLENIQSHDLGDFLKLMPHLKDVRLLNAVHQEICTNSQQWIDPQFEGVFQLFWAVSLRVIGQNSTTLPVYEKFEEDEDELFDRCVQVKPFHWLKRRLLTVDGLQKEEFFCRRLHSFISQMIFGFPIKLKELRTRAEEECRQIKSGETGPIHFEQLLYFIGDFYKGDVLKLNLSSSYFCPLDCDYATINKMSQIQVSLFKFVRESGESLSPILYMAYLHMLTGLSNNEESAGRCFSMLKAFANYGSHLSTLSFDHFFAALSQYYHTLRAERASAAVHIPHVVSHHYIAPDELKGLESWLVLISSIARYSARSRIAFCDDSRWSCLSIMFGLLGCSVPLELKGLMFKCLSSFALSAELSQVLLDGLLASGVVSHLPDGKLSGLQQELDEVEARNEYYPATIGLVDFLSSLVANVRSASFDGIAFRPYFSFVLDSVLVQFQNRSYKNIKDMWHLGSVTAKFLYNLVANFEATSANVKNQTPDCQLMTLLISDSPAFRTVMGIIDSGVQIFDEYLQFPGKEKLEETTLTLLKLIFTVLSKQEMFVFYLHDVQIPVLTSSMDVLLQTMNPKTRLPDYSIKIACYLSYYGWLPEHCLFVVKILAILHTISLSFKSNFLKYISAKSLIAGRILNGFANCLSMDEVDAPVACDTSLENAKSKETVKALAALSLLEFLVEAIRTNFSQTMNFVHFLLGFDIKKDTVLQNAGFDQTPKNCLHAVLAIVEGFCGHNLRALSYGALVEPAYRLLYWLCAQKLSAEPVLRYLRSQNDFLFRHLTKFRLENDDPYVDLQRKEIIGWLFKLGALELQSSNRLNYRSNINRILKFLYSFEYSFEDDQSSSNVGGGGGGNTSIFGLSSKPSNVEKEKRKILAFLHYIDCKAGTVSAPKVQYFDGNRLSQVVSACTVETSKGYSECLIERVHDVLHSEAQSVQGTSLSGQLHLLHDEIEQLLLSIVQYNEAQRLSYIRRHTFDGWRQLVEISLLSCTMDIFPIEERIQAIGEIFVTVLNMDIPSSLSRNVASLLLTLTASLRQQFVSTLLESIDVDASLRDQPNNFEGSRYVSVLDGTYVRGANLERVEELKHLSILSTAFRLLLDFLMKSENRRSPQTRALLYGSLMNFIRMTMKPLDASDQVSASVSHPSIRERMVENHRKILKNYIIELIELLAKDAFDGPEVCKLLARACLLTVMTQNSEEESKLVSLLISRGYNEFQVGSMLTENDPVLQQFLGQQQNLTVR